ncbi:MAG: methyltransferase domain-containing protein, partial [Candidatus Omnitrophota bacterium]
MLKDDDYLFRRNELYIKRCGIRTDDTVLDVGTFGGWGAILASRLTRNAVFGIDISEQAIEQATENAQMEGVNNVEFFVRNALDLQEQFSEGSIDVVLSDSTFCYMPARFRALALAQMWRVAQRSINILEYTPLIASDLKAWNASEWRANLEKLGIPPANIDISDEGNFYFIKVKKSNAEYLSQDGGLQIGSNVLRPLAFQESSVLLGNAMPGTATSQKRRSGAFLIRGDKSKHEELCELLTRRTEWEFRSVDLFTNPKRFHPRTLRALKQMLADSESGFLEDVIEEQSDGLPWSFDDIRNLFITYRQFGEFNYILQAQALLDRRAEFKVLDFGIVISCTPQTAVDTIVDHDNLVKLRSRFPRFAHLIQEPHSVQAIRVGVRRDIVAFTVRWKRALYEVGVDFVTRGPAIRSGERYQGKFFSNDGRASHAMEADSPAGQLLLEQIVWLLTVLYDDEKTKEAILFDDVHLRRGDLVADFNDRDPDVHLITARNIRAHVTPGQFIRSLMHHVEPVGLMLGAKATIVFDPQPRTLVRGVTRTLTDKYGLDRGLEKAHRWFTSSAYAMTRIPGLTGELAVIEHRLREAQGRSGGEAQTDVLRPVARGERSSEPLLQDSFDISRQVPAWRQDLQELEAHFDELFEASGSRGSVRGSLASIRADLRHDTITLEASRRIFSELETLSCEVRDLANRPIADRQVADRMLERFHATLQSALEARWHPATFDPLTLRFIDEMQDFFRLVEVTDTDSKSLEKIGELASTTIWGWFAKNGIHCIAPRVQRESDRIFVSLGNARERTELARVFRDAKGTVRCEWTLTAPATAQAIMLPLMRQAAAPHGIRVAILDWDGTVSDTARGYQWITAGLIAAVIDNVILTDEDMDRLKECALEALWDVDTLIEVYRRHGLIGDSKFSEETMRAVSDYLKTSAGLTALQEAEWAVSYAERHKQRRFSAPAERSAYLQRWAREGTWQIEDLNNPQSLKMLRLGRIMRERDPVERERLIREVTLPGAVELIHAMNGEGFELNAVTGADEESVRMEADIV